MYLFYFDQSGDYCYPIYSTEIFVPTSVYDHYTVWQHNQKTIYEFRKYLKEKFQLTIKEGFNTKEFITYKDPYHSIYSPAISREIIYEFCKFIPTLKLKCISIVIDKKKINRPEYDALKNALTYNIQRISNSLKNEGKNHKFLIITNKRRVSKMRKTKLIQKYNVIPSYFENRTYLKEIDSLIEDPLPKDYSK